jgi:hypothetical protein
LSLEEGAWGIDRTPALIWAFVHLTVVHSVRSTLPEPELVARVSARQVGGLCFLIPPPQL